MVKKVMWKPTVRSKFTDNRELTVFIILVVSVMILLYPKGKIENLILNYKDYNIDLGNIYLENLTRINRDPNLRLLLAQRYAQIGDIKRSEEILRELENTELRDKVLMVRYERLKFMYFSTEDSESKKMYKQSMREMLEHLYRISYDLRVLEKIHTESISMGLVDVALKTSIKISKLKDDENVHWLKVVYKNALATENYQVALKYCDLLKVKDRENYLFWLKEEYRIASGLKEYITALEDALKLLILESGEKYKKDIVYLLSKSQSTEVIFQYIDKYPNRKYTLFEILADFYILNKDYKNAFSLYVSIYVAEKNKINRRNLFKKIVTLLLGSRRYEEVKMFIGENYREHIQDIEMAKFILSSSLATGDPDFSYKIAKDIHRLIR
ncbi:MAG: hypothetical protein N2Z80_02755 [Hydrogenothermaceae bacterium]|nr:hypothetical protein [Hydrogenothermaceae bacterium]